MRKTIMIESVLGKRTIHGHSFDLNPNWKGYVCELDLSEWYIWQSSMNPHKKPIFVVSEPKATGPIEDKTPVIKKVRRERGNTRVKRTRNSN